LHPVYRNLALVCSALEHALELVAADRGAIRSGEALYGAGESRMEVSRRLDLFVQAVRRKTRSISEYALDGPVRTRALPILLFSRDTSVIFAVRERL
jgi:hypothetical protein